MDRYLGGEQIDEKLLIEDLETAIARGGLLPGHAGVRPDRHRSAASCSTCACARSRRRPSTSRRTSSRRRGRPRPPVTCDPAGPLVAEVVKTTSDPYLGRVSLVRVFSGTLNPDASVHVSGHFSSFGTDGPRGPRRGRADRRPGVPVRAASRCSPRGCSPATSRSSAGCRAPRPATRCPPPTRRGCSARGRCPTRCSRSRSRPRPGPTRTSCPPPSPGSPPRTRASGSTTTPRPGSSSSG